MITRTEAERIAASIHVVRPDWPVTSLVTLIARDLADWPLLDVYVGLAHVAIERNIDGSWVTRTPARVKENGPWRWLESMAASAVRDHQRYQAEVESAHATAHYRAEANRNCPICDDNGYLEGERCRHWYTVPDGMTAAEAKELVRASILENRRKERGLTT